MDKENHNKINTEILKLLEDIISICKNLNCQFRIFGSLIPAAAKGKFYRKIGDIDCFIDNRFKKVVASKLEKKGYIKSTQRDDDIPSPMYLIGFRTENFIKNDKKLSLFFVSFEENYMKIPLKFGLSFRVHYNLINKNYKFYGKEFKGLTPEAALFNLPLTADETKRKIDFNVLSPLCNLKAIQKIRKNTDTFFWFNKRLPLISKILASKIDKYSLNSKSTSTRL